jgi:hypothetical protein
MLKSRLNRKIYFSVIFIAILLLSTQRADFCLAQNDDEKCTDRHFSLEVNVLSEIVEIKIKNLGEPIELNENVKIEKWDNNSKKWVFAACPLWTCGTKESVARRIIQLDETQKIVWKKKLHSCKKAEIGKYRVVIQHRQGALLSDPVEFDLTDMKAPL